MEDRLNMMKNGFQQLYEFLFLEDERILFEVMQKDGQTSVDCRGFCELVSGLAFSLRQEQAEMTAGKSRTRFLAVQIKNSPILYASVFAALQAGFDVLLVDPKLGEEPRKQLLQEADAKILLTDRPGADADWKCLSAAELQQKALQEQKNVKNADKEAPAKWGRYLAFATSGTTGPGRIIAYEGAAVCRQVMRTVEWFRETPFMTELLSGKDPQGERVMSILPMHHIFGCLCPLILMGYGFRILFPKNDAITTILGTMASAQVWGCLSVPMFWQTVLNLLRSRYGEVSADSIGQLAGENLKFCLTGGTYADPGLRRSFLEAGIGFSLGFGMTETGCCTMHFMSVENMDSEGYVYPWYEAEICTEDGQRLKNGTGELLLKSDALFSGYIQGGDLIPWEPEGDGYYRTGDIFCKEESRLTFVGRCKNLIVNASGENIYIEELEQSFEALAGFGLLYGIIECNSEPVLVVQLRGGENREQLLRCITEIVGTLPVYQRPQRAVLTKSVLPVTAKGEIRRRQITDEMLDDPGNIVQIYKR